MRRREAGRGKEAERDKEPGRELEKGFKRVRKGRERENQHWELILTYLD